ncbi:class D beta-lactamase [Silvanigrella aquatica]|uniref:Beta-lactamase n=1 Tax=Silvanigrella aquatica TaxID=1915309 RepID=A0A1L4D228_9BACT|nr:class D beta-lactamase [Silvanigrella aquatica]APJ04259.1 class D beta-lactamase [Silvanigrella aquatica]
MKKIFSLFAIISCFHSVSYADCFILSENNKNIIKEGDCETAYTPASTFKIPISLIGYNEKILKSETQPKLNFEEGYVDWLDKWKQPHDPKLWMANSCVWYSQLITKKVGMDKFKKYMNDFNYGNKDLSGDKNKDNGLERAWLSSSLEISPEQQLNFLYGLNNKSLKVIDLSYKMTQNILFNEALKDDWKLYGKTGNGNVLNRDKTQKTERQVGWFVGWIEKKDRKIMFVHLIVDSDKKDSYASLRSKAKAKEKLEHYLKNN